MSGIEPVAAVGAAAVTKAVSKVAEEDPKEADLLRKIAEETGDLEPAARLLARRVAVKQLIRLKLWQPLGMLFGASRDYFDTQFENDMADRMADIPEEDVITPKLSIAGPTVQGISFTAEEPDLKEMYLNLLATASDRRVQSMAHPSFAEVIRQLNAEEAKLLTGVLAASQLPIVEIRRHAKTADNPNARGYRTVAASVLHLRNALGGQVWNNQTAVYVDNWVRLGLVNVDYQVFMTDEANYGWVEANPRYVSAQAEFDTEELKRVTFQKGVLTVTPFGRRFHEVAVAGATSRAEPETPSGESSP